MISHPMDDWPGILSRQYLFETAPFASCHAATLAEASDGTIVGAFFGGTREGAADVCVWTSRYERGRWTPLVRAGDGGQPDGTSLPCWNPVLFQPRNASGGPAGPLLLFYKVGPSPARWWGMVRHSWDGGCTWDAAPADRLPPGLLGPAKNKPVQLPTGRIISPCSVELPDGGGWRVYFERSDDAGATWRATPPVAQPAEIPRAVQPTLLTHGGGRLQAICRTNVGRLCECWSQDNGRNWSPVRLTDLPNCNSGVDAVTLAAAGAAGAAGVRHLLVYNHSNLEKVRYPLCVAASADGERWRAAAVLEDAPPGQYSYPAIIQSSDGLAHIAYTWKRRNVAHVVLDPARLQPREITAFSCPPPGSPTHRADEFQ